MLVPPPKQHTGRALRAPRLAFTLIELLVVIAVIGILFGITVAVSSGVIRAQNRALAQGELVILAQALESFKSTYGDYPWAEGDPDSSSAQNAEILFRSLTGWREFTYAQGQISGMRDLPAGEGPKKAFITPEDVGVQLPDGAETLDEAWAPDTPPPEGLYFADPWTDEDGDRNPYLYVYDGSNRGTRGASSWEGFGFVLFSKGPDGLVDGADYFRTGVLPESMTTDPSDDNLDNIYPGK